MSENTEKKLWLGVEDNSQLAGVLRRLASNPSIKTSEVCQLWQQHARGGGHSALSPTRASFLVDILADATEGRGQARRPHKGVAVVKGVRDNVRTDTPRHNAVTVLEESDVRVRADEVRVTAGSGPAPAAAHKDDVDVQGNHVIFPDQPIIPEASKKFVPPTWYGRIKMALDAGKHISIAGPPGQGKSMAAEQYFIEKKQPFVVINGEGGLRRRDLEGFTDISKGTTVFQAADYAAAVVNGWGVILNEVNACEPDALLFLNGQLEIPFSITIHGRSYPVHPNFRLIVTYNPGLVGTKALPQAFKDRFFPIKLGFVERSFLKQMLVANGMNADADYANPILDFAGKAWDAHVKGTIRYQISPRRLYDTVFLLERVPDLKVIDALIEAVVSAVDSSGDQDGLRRLL